MPYVGFRPFPFIRIVVVKTLKRACFGLLGLLLAVLTAATVAEKICGTPWVTGHVYASAWFALMWGLLALLSLAYLFRRRLQRRPAVFLLHIALVTILTGAGITRLCGRQGTLHLRTDEALDSFDDDRSGSRALPFRVRLDGFRIDFYPGTRAPMDYVSALTLIHAKDTLQGEVAMNRILSWRNYRFYQSSYDEDGAGVTLRVSHDPWGIGVTYTGYALLLLAMIAYFLDPGSAFRNLLRHPALRRSALCLLFGCCAFAARAAGPGPRTLPRDAAAAMGNLHVYYNDRICPLSTLARDFTVKLCGKSHYRGLTPEQVLCGWLFYYDDWKQEPVIRIRSAEARRLLGIEGRYARLTDFGNAIGTYRLQDASGKRGVGPADEQFNLVAMLCGGNLLRLFPYTDPSDGLLHWASQVDDLPRDLPHEQWLFIRRAMNYVNELVAARDYAGVEEVLRKIRAYQARECGDQLPSPARFRAEQIYNRIDMTLPLAVALILAGVASYFYACRRLMKGCTYGMWVRYLLDGGIVAALALLSLTLALRGYAAGHWPLSNGFETMQFLAWSTLLLALALRRHFLLVRPFGCLVAGLALMVSVMGESNPQITPLMPVLSSPLLCVHVVLVMVAYALLAFTMLNGVTGLVLHLAHRDRETVELQLIGRLTLYPAVFCLAAGIFVGAVWANVSWGRYWGWDPKEVWALITMLVYALALHAGSLPRFRRPLFFHAFCVAAFLTVLVTYFGVNFLLGGMHSYA